MTKISPLVNRLPSAAGHRGSSPDRRRLYDPAVELDSLTIIFGRTAVLHNVDLQLNYGEIVAVMGPNGAGKSTLLSCLAGALRPNAGNVRWFGESPRSNAIRKQIGFAGQEPALYGELTVMENLVFAGRMYGVATVHNRAEELLAHATLLSYAHRPVGQLSQGIRQRVAILRAVVHDPQVIVLDEPSAKLDTVGQTWLANLLAHRRETGRAVCFASHDLHLCQKCADHILHLDAGRVRAIEQTSDAVGTLSWSA